MRDRETRWESILVEDLGHSLRVEFTGGRQGDLEDDPCIGEYDAEVVETDDTITITIYSLKLVDPPSVPDDWTCTDEGYQRRFDVSVGGAGLNGRVVVDGSTGETRTVIDETTILMPTELPEGWVEWYRGPHGSAMEFAYGPDGGDGFPPLMYTAAPTDNGYFNLDRDTIEQDLTSVEEIGVRDNTSGAYLRTSLEDGARTVLFEEGGRHHRITVQAGIDVAVALAFVESLS